MEELDRERLKRLRIFAIVLAVGLAAILGRLVDLQLVRGEAYAVLAEQQRLRPVPIPAPRGRILDRYGVPLAQDRPAFTASLVYTGRPLSEQERSLLRRLLQLSDDEIDAALRQLREYPFYPARLKVDLTLEEYTRLEEHRHLLPGVVVEVIPVRHYPRGTLAAHVLGHVQAGAVAGQGVVIGVAGAPGGLEGAFDGPVTRDGRTLRGLAGVDGREFVEVDARIRPRRVLGRQDPEPGNDIVTTLDARLQAAAEAALDEQLRWLRQARVDPCPCPATAGAVVALDVQTGAILAMASRPTFNPADFAVLPFLPRDSARRLQLSAAIARLQRDPTAPFLNRAMRAAYPPGSAFKMVTALAGLGQGLGNLRVYDPGFLEYGGRTWRDWRAHGTVDLIKAIGQSCNVFFWTMALRMGIGPILDVAQQFGFGRGTGFVDLPGELSGRLPEPVPQNLLPAAIGQGQNQFTPLQMAHYVATLATGVRYRPYLVQEIRSPDGTVLWRAKPEVMARLDIPAEQLERVRQGMRAVVQGGPGWSGTAQWRFAGAPYTSAGKTGTVQRGRGYGSSMNHGWYVAYAPAGPGETPRIAVAVVVEGGGGGSLAAAPIARRVLDAYFAAAGGEREPPVPAEGVSPD